MTCNHDPNHAPRTFGPPGPPVAVEEVLIQAQVEEEILSLTAESASARHLRTRNS